MADDGDTWNCPVCGILALVSDLPGTSGCLHQPPRIGCPREPLRQIGPCQMGRLAGMIVVRCPRDYDELMRSAGGEWEPAQHCWLIAPRRIGPVLRVLLREVDPLFRWAGIGEPATGCEPAAGWPHATPGSE